MCLYVYMCILSCKYIHIVKTHTRMHTHTRIVKTHFMFMHVCASALEVSVRVTHSWSILGLALHINQPNRNHKCPLASTALRNGPCSVCDTQSVGKFMASIKPYKAVTCNMRQNNASTLYSWPILQVLNREQIKFHGH